MKIGFLGPAPPHKGGISQFALSLAKAFLDQGHDVKMFGFKKQYPKLIFSGKSQTSEFTLPEGLEIENLFIPYRPCTWGRAVSKIKEFKPDLLIVSYFIPFFAPAYITICHRLKGIRIIALVHNLIPHESWPGAKLLARVFLKQCQGSIYLSKATLGQLKSLMPNSIAKRARLGFHPAYTQYLARQEKPLPREPYTVLFFGLIKKYKGLQVLIEAMPLVLKQIPQAKLIIAGEVYGKDDGYLQQIEELHIEDQVEPHLRYIPDDEVAGFFQRASLCVLPYLSATQSGVIALSYAFGLPVLASNLDGLAEYIDEGSSGLLADAEPHRLAEKIILYFKKDMFHTMHPKVLKKAAEYSWGRLAELFLP